MTMGLTGSQDWYPSGLSESRGIMSDSGELAVRLGSPVFFDRTAKMLFIWDGTDYHPMIGFASTQSTPNMRISNDAYYTGGASFAHDFDGSVIGSYFYARKRLPPFASVNMAFELGFYLPIDDILLYVNLKKYSEAGAFSARVQYDFENKVINIHTGGSYVKVGDIDFNLTDGDFFSTIRVVLDSENNEYKRLQLNHIDLDVSGYPMVDSGATVLRQWICDWYFYNQSHDSGTLYLDRLLIGDDY